jgi:hypothetical protein
LNQRPTALAPIFWLVLSIHVMLAVVEQQQQQQSL